MVDPEQRKILDAKLETLNKAVGDAVAARTKWMDEHMADYSKFQIGDEIYSKNGIKLGIVAELYRYHAGDSRFDTSMYIHQRYRVDNGGFEYLDNRITRFPFSRSSTIRSSLNALFTEANAFESGENP